MIYPNEAAQDYEFRAVCTLAKTRTGTMPMVAGAKFELGFGYEFPIWARVVSAYDSAENTGRWRAQLGSSELGINKDYDGSGWYDNISMRLKLYDAVLTATCEQWHLTASDLDWWYKIGSGAETLGYNHGAAVSILGDFYDRRDNTMSVLPIAWFGSEDIPLEKLPSYPSYGPSVIDHVQAAVTFGWRNDAGEPDVQIDQTFDVPDTNCDCEASPSTIDTGSPPPTVWEVNFSAEALNQIDQVYLGQKTCYCDPDNHEVGLPTIVHSYRMDQIYRVLKASGRLHPTDAQIPSSYRTACARCSDPEANPLYQEDPFTCIPEIGTFDAETYIAWHKDVLNVLASKHYAFVTQQGTCPITDPENPNPPVPEPCWDRDDTICWYEAELQHNHERPGCDEEGASVHQWREADGRLFAALSGASMIQVLRHRVGIASDLQDVIAADVTRYAQGAIHPRGRHHLVYRGPSIEDPEDIRLVEIWSLSSCASGMWSEPVTIGDYTYFGFAIDPSTGVEYLIVYDAGDTQWVCLRKKPQETSFTEVGVVATGISTGAMAGLEIDASAKHRLVAVYRGASNLERKYSMDGGATWRA